MELKQLESFVYVVKYGSFTKAAEKLFISQPSISTHIRLLEKELNSTLIVRTTKSIQVTIRGQELYECATAMLSLQKNLLDRWEEGTKHQIQLGASTIPSAYILPEILPMYRQEAPEVSFIIHETISQGVIDGLLDGSFHVGLTGMTLPEKTLEFIPFYTDRMVLITPTTKKYKNFQKNNTSPIEIIKQSPLIMRQKGSGSKKYIDSIFSHLGLEDDDLQVSARLNDPEAIKNLVAEDFGISVISERAVTQYKERGQLLTFDLPEEIATRHLYLVYSKYDNLPSHTQDFIHFMKNYYHMK